MNKNYYAIIMAGGVGSRFWPVSTTEFPKQFHDMLGAGDTLIQKTFSRLSKLIPAENILILTLRCRQVIIVETRTTQPSKDKQANPGTTAAPTNKGSLQTFPLKNPAPIVAVPI